MKELISSSEVVILWGVDESIDFLNEDLKSKTTIVIDPVETKIAKISDLHVAIQAQGDIFLAVILSRFLFISDMLDIEFLQKYADEYQDYEDFTQEFRIVLTLKKIGLDTIVIKNILEIIANKKVMIICGNGLGKYEDLDEIKDVLNAFGMLLGLFDKEGCGIVHVDSKGYKKYLDLENEEFEFIDEVDTDILKDK